MNNFEKYIEAMKKDREIPENVEQKWQETILAIRQTADEQKNKDHSAEISATTEITAERKEVNIIMKTFKNIAVACACLVAVFGISVGTAKVNPTFADAMSNVPIIGNVFENLRQNENVTLEGADGEQYPVIKENPVDYNVLEKEARKPEIEDVTTVENNGLTLTIDNYLCDGDNMVINFTAVNNNPNVENATVIWGDAYTLIDGKCIDLATGIQMVQSTETPNLYTGTMSFPLTYTSEESQRMTYFSISEKTPLEITFRNLTMDVPFGKDENKDFGSFTGSYKLSLGVTPDSETKKYDINYTDEATGIEIKSVTKSKLETKVEYALPWKYSDFNGTESVEIFSEDGTSEGFGPKYSIILQGYDENGNLISGSGYGGKNIFVDKDGNQYDPYAEDFTGNDGLTEIKTGGFTTTEAKSITIKVVNKQEQDENGNMKVFFEYTVPLD